MIIERSLQTFLGCHIVIHFGHHCIILLV